MSTAADVVTGYLGAFSRGNPDEISGFVSDGFENNHLSSIASSCAGIEEYRRRLPGFLEMFVGRAYAVLNVVEQAGDSQTDVVVRYDFTGSYEGMAFDIPGVMWFTVVDDQITSRLDVWDSGTFLAQTAKSD
ncbi:MAG: hypothetical protein ACJAXA_003466 [Candidatus Aldehydirespiratoraceae bacterium]|jgi:hypothetical protein